MIPCKECLVRATCISKADSNQELTYLVKELTQKCDMFHEYFPFFTNTDKVLYSDDSVVYPKDFTDITEEDWKVIAYEVYDFLRGFD